MNGPYPPGTCTVIPAPSDWDWETGRLTRGQRYSVVQSFVDADGNTHHVGEQWAFIGTMFSKFDDQLTLWVRRNSGEEWQIPLIWKSQRQEDLIEHFTQYVRPI